jgi:outer membrane lipase/esterase
MIPQLHSMKMSPLTGARFLLAILILSIAAVPIASAGTAFSKIVAFGDSVTDHDNLFRLTGGAFPKTPAYANGRQSNGPVWIEYLAARLGLANQLQNYAVVGAMTEPAPDFPTGNVMSTTFTGLEGTDVAGQVQKHLAESKGVVDPRALYVLQGGPNDFPRVENPAVIVQNLIKMLIQLQQAGAKHIILVALPDFGRTPRAILAEQYGLVPPGSTAIFSFAARQLNTALVSAAASVTASDVSVTIVDMYRLLNDIAADPGRYGMIEIQMPYIMAGVGTDPARWLFWDDLHPTTRGHEFLAEHAIIALIETYSPRQGAGNGSGVINALRGLVSRPGKG